MVFVCLAFTEEAMKYTLVIALTLGLSAAAVAQGRPDSTHMTCAAARALVARAGAIVLGTGGPTYDGYVLHRGFCTPSQQTEVSFIPTADNPACYAGDRCIERYNANER